MLMTVHGTTPKNSSIEVQHWTALMSRSVCFIQRSITTPSIDIFMIASSGMPSVRNILRGSRGLRLHVGIFVFQPADPAKDLGKIERLDGDAVRFEDLLAITDRVERGRPRADGADRAVAQAIADAADGGEPGEVRGEFGRIRRLGVQRVSEYGMRYCWRLLQSSSFRRNCRGGRRSSSCRRCPGVA